MENKNMLNDEQSQKVSGGDITRPGNNSPVKCFACESENVEYIKSQYDKVLKAIFRYYRCKDCGYEFKVVKKS